MARAAELLKRVRTDAGLTQAELARRLGTTQTAIARLERWDANPRLATLDRAMRATGHRLQLEAVPAATDVDEDQMAAHLQMTPAERARAHEAAYHNLRESTRGSQAARLTAWLEFKPREILGLLTARGVDFVVIGGYAAVLHGSPA